MSPGSEEGRDRASAPHAAEPGCPASEIIDSLAELFGLVRAHFERVVQPLDIPPPCAKALRLIDGSISMKDLGARIHCDASFVTAIADMLEERELARREGDPADRRVKRLVLTRRGCEVRERLARELFDDVPGIRTLDEAERQSLARLVRKMVAAEGGGAAAAGEAGAVG